MKNSFKERATVKLAVILSVWAVFFGSLFLGRYPVSPSKVVSIILSRLLPFLWSSGRLWDKNAETVILLIRMPRILAAVLVGTGLAVSGAALQGLFRNPLVSPYILGVSSGAGFGAALAILLSLSALFIQVSAFGFGMAAVVLSILISSSAQRSGTLTLVLSGIIVSSFFAALISLLKYAADPTDKLPAIVFWLMGSLTSVSYRELAIIAPVITVGVAVLLFFGWQMNVLAMGEEEAHSMGINPKAVKVVVITASALITAASVSVSGIIGWVGLVIPHIARMTVGPDYRKLIPFSALLGAGYLILMDDISRSAVSIEIPLGILTAVIGAPIFAQAMRRSKPGWIG
ncbi:MAG: iron ABC transporter permease [Spirochaetales bacterium]|nr:iron ABC transporter permease [Spirochaetales bacterium]